MPTMRSDKSLARRKRRRPSLGLHLLDSKRSNAVLIDRRVNAKEVGRELRHLRQYLKALNALPPGNDAGKGYIRGAYDALCWANNTELYRAPSRDIKKEYGIRPGLGRPQKHVEMIQADLVEELERGEHG